MKKNDDTTKIMPLTLDDKRNRKSFFAFRQLICQRQNVPFNVPESFPHWDQNTLTASFDSKSLSGGDGLYEFKLEIFDQNGNAVSMPRNVYQVPGPNTFTPSICCGVNFGGHSSYE